VKFTIIRFFEIRIIYTFRKLKKFQKKFFFSSLQKFHRQIKSNKEKAAGAALPLRENFKKLLFIFMPWRCFRELTVGVVCETKHFVGLNRKKKFLEA
jgi:hypothetical protein